MSALGGVLSPDSSVSPDSSLETVAGPEERFAAAEPELALASQPLTPAADVALEAVPVQLTTRMGEPPAPPDGPPPPSCPPSPAAPDGWATLAEGVGVSGPHHWGPHPHVAIEPGGAGRHGPSRTLSYRPKWPQTVHFTPW